MLGDAAEAEDVVQESFVKLWVNAKGWAPSGGGLGAWLRRIATNACLDRLRKPRGISDDVLAEHADDGPPADALIDEARRREAVAGAIQALPDRQRAAIVLTYYEGVSNAEAASILGLGVKALEIAAGARAAGADPKPRGAGADRRRGGMSARSTHCWPS